MGKSITHKIVKESKGRKDTTQKGDLMKAKKTSSSIKKSKKDND